MMSENDKTKLEDTIRGILSLKINCIVSKFVKNDGIYHYLYNDIMDYTSFMNIENSGFDFDVKTRLFFIGKGWRDFPMCKNDNCKNRVINHRNITSLTYDYAYPAFCSKECKYHKNESAAILEEHKRYIEELRSRSDEEYVEEIAKICSEHPTYPHKHIRNEGFETRHLYDFIIRKTSFLDNEMTVEPKFNTRIYWIVNGLTEFPRCHHCGHIMNDINPYSFASGYPYFCSYECERNASKEELAAYYETYSKTDLDKYNSKTYSEMENELKEFVRTHREYSNILKRPNGEYHYLYKFVLDNTKFLDDFYTFKTRVFFILNGWKEERRCHNKNCGKVIKKNLRSIYEKFPDYCSGKCSHNDEIMEKTKNTLIERYGVDNIISIKGVLEKSARTKKRNFEIRKKEEYDRYQSSLEEYQRDGADYWKLNDDQKQKFRNELRRVVNENPHGYSNSILSDGGSLHYLYGLIIQCTSPLLSDSFYDFTTKVCFAMNGWTKFPRCKQCGKRLDHKNLSIWERGYPRFCSPRCGTLYAETSEKMASTNIERYGYRNAMQNAEVKRRNNDTRIERYGTLGIFGVPEQKQKYIETSRRNYGTDYPMQNEAIREKQVKSFVNHYNADNWWECDELREKYKTTMIEKYGVENPGKSKSIRAKTVKTNIDRYGVENPMQNVDIQKKCKKRYTYCGIQFDSSWELAFYIWLTDNDIDFEYHPSISFDYEVNGKIHHYFPDFRVEDRIIEVKGSQFFDDNGYLINPYYDDDEKSLCKQKCMNDNGVIIYKERDITPFLNYVKTTYGKKYLTEFINVME